MLKLTFFVPQAHLDPVKKAVFQAGAGKQGDYDSCCWQVLGYGQFRPLEGADPYIGNTGEIETVAEYRVETLCSDDCIRDVVDALKSAHPYEEPAFDVVRLVDID